METNQNPPSNKRPLLEEEQGSTSKKSKKSVKGAKRNCIVCRIPCVCKIPECWNDIIGLDITKGLCFTCAKDE